MNVSTTRWSSVAVALAVVVSAMVGVTACNKNEEPETTPAKTPPGPPAPSGTMSLHGLYTYLGTTGVFRECRTGQQWTVANEGNNGVLEQAYFESGAQAGSPVVVTVEGGIDYRQRPDGSGREVMLIVARFVQLGPGESCPLAN